MGDGRYSRREFLKKIGVDKAQETDSLFGKYARKKPGRRPSGGQFNNSNNRNNNNGTTANRNGNVTSTLAPYVGTWTEAEVMHLLRRTSFGVKKADVVALTAMTPSASVDFLLTFPTTPVLPSATPLNHYANALSLGVPAGDSSGVPLGGDWTNSNLQYLSGAPGLHDTFVGQKREEGLMYWSWGIALDDATSIREKMTLFWYHFIPISFTGIRNVEVKSNMANASYFYMKILRDHSVGNFKTMTKAIAKSPAMLVYLSNQYSTAAAPNENFARELMELFTMGKVPVQHYDEADIKAASKVLSGWRVSNFKGPGPFVYGFDDAYHNQSDKVFSANFGNTTIYNQPGANGANEFDIFFDMLFTEQADTIARYICRRLYRFFVYYDIDATIETNIIAPLAATFLTNNFDILPVIKQLLQSEHFFDIANRGVMIKSPFDLLTGILRTCNINSTAGTTTTTLPNGTSVTTPQIVNQYTVWQYFYKQAYTSLEQGYGLVPNVSGWKAYYQEPAFYQNWINTNTIQQRESMIGLMVGPNGVTQGNTSMKFNPIAWVNQFIGQTPSSMNVAIEDPLQLVDLVVRYLLPMDIDTTTKQQLIRSSLLGNQITNNYWTIAWNNYAGAPTNSNYASIVKSRLLTLFVSVAKLAEFQLM